MEKDYNEKKRLQYDQQIMETEEKMDQLNAEKRKIQENMEDLNMELQRGFRGLQDLNEELVKKGDSSARWRQDENDGKHRFLRQLLTTSDDELESICRKEIQRLDDTRTQLQKERSTIPWD